MKSRFFTLLLLVAFTIAATTQVNSQCSMIGLIGEPTAWADDIVMDRDAENPAIFTMFITLTAEQDTDENGFVDVKFRQLGDWGNNWGDTAFPTGTGVADGDNLQALPGSYFVTFNCETGDYSFETTCAHVGLIGEPTAWADDIVMTRSTDDISIFTTVITLTEDQDTDENGFVDVKFRQLGDWGNNWGDAAFPTGTGVGDGSNIEALPGTYFVTFNCSTGDYSFESTCADLGIIGEPTAWADDILMTRSADDMNVFTTVLTLTADQDTDENGFVDIKFRKLGDWGTNWGDAAFPTGTGVADGDNIQALPGIYLVTFNCSTGEYSFDATCGEIGMIGEFNNWNGDFPMVRDASNPNMWTTIKSLAAAHDGDSDGDIEVKFRQDADWTANWGAPAFPSGIALSGGDNILGLAGTYDVSFNCSTGAYNFVTNDDVCGDIGIVGDFNTWGVGDDDVVTDVNLVRDPNSPSQFSLDYSFTSGTKLVFRENADQLFADVWGGVSFPSGTGVVDGGVTQLDVPGGNYRITFNCTSGDYNFIRLGSSVSAPKVFALNIDGDPSEADWDFSQNVSQVVDGEAGDDPVTADFAVAYNEEKLYIAGKIVDADILTGVDDSDAALFFVDGNKNGGDYDDNDIALMVFADGGSLVLQGPDGITPEVAVTATANGYAIEVSIDWADLGITPEEGSQIGFDFGVKDGDEGVYKSTIMWNGDANNAEQTSALGDLLFGSLACGNLSLYGDMIGDVTLQTPTETPSTYVATYMFEDPMNVVFRKDNDDVVSWGVDAFPSGNAVIDGAAIPVAAGRYRVAFSCIDGAFSFTEEAAGDDVALANYAASDVAIDGDLSEYSLDYGMDVGVVVGAGPDNNTVTWGASWDENNLYLGVHVIDDIVEGTANPWDNDAMEFYFDGNHDADGAYDGDFDTQLILHAADESILWVKADGVPITVYESNWTATADGYNVELSLAWSNFGFTPGRNRSIGFSLANNDSDNGIGRDYQTAYAGTADNWNNTAVLGDLQLTGGPLVDVEEPTFFNHTLTLFPNPASSKGAFLISSDGEVFTGETQLNIYNLIGQVVRTESVDFNTGAVRVESNDLTTGTYFVHLLSANGKQAVKKVIIK